MGICVGKFRKIKGPGRMVGSEFEPLFKAERDGLFRKYGVLP